MTQWDIEIRSSRYSTVAHICLNHIGEHLASLASEDRQQSPSAVFVPSCGVAEALPLISSLIDGSLPHRSCTYIHSCLFSLTSVTVPVPDGRRCTSTSPLCFLWKAGVKLSPPSCFHQCVVLREFPISLTVRVGFTSRDTQTN